MGKPVQIAMMLMRVEGGCDCEVCRGRLETWGICLEGNGERVFFGPFDSQAEAVAESKKIEAAVNRVLQERGIDFVRVGGEAAARMTHGGDA